MRIFCYFFKQKKIGNSVSFDPMENDELSIAYKAGNEGIRNLTLMTIGSYLMDGPQGAALTFLMSAGHVGQIVVVDHIVAAHRRQFGVAVTQQDFPSVVHRNKKKIQKND